MAFPDGFLEELCAKSDIVETVSRYVSLTRRGSNHVGLCPFHNEKTPSFSVSQDKQFFHCFGCGVGGDVISFVMRVENLDFPDAVRVLAERAGMTVPENDAYEKSIRKKRDRLHALMSDAGRHFHQALMSDIGKNGLEYLQNRGLSIGTIRKFGAGFAPESWDYLIRAMSEKGYTKAELMEAGLAVSNKTGGIYDRFRNRVMFPIIDVRGNVIGFGGRVLGDGEPKYLNSPETPIFNKRKNLFALNYAKKSDAQKIILAEGYMDVIALHQAGFDSAVASLGTSLTEEQARLIARYKNQAVIAYDADGAGQKAATRAIDILKSAGVDVKILRMAGAKDPDEFIKKFGRERFAKLIDNSEADVEYRLHSAKAGFDLEDDIGRIEYLKKAAKLLARVGSSIEREVYITRVAKETGVSVDALSHEVKKERRALERKSKREEEKKELAPIQKMMPKERSLRYNNPRCAAAEEGLVALLFASQDNIANAGERVKPDEFSSPLLARAYELELECAKAGRECSMTVFTEHMSPEELNHISGILAKRASFCGNGALADYIAVIKQEALKKNDKDGDDPLLATAKMYREKKGYGGE